jgi:hypothetical protein
MVDLITNAHTLFDDHHPGASSPPLPPAPPGEPVPPILYGSSHTTVAELPPDDFTPKLPPRPPSSIHPSSRVNGGGSMSPTKSEFDSPFTPPPPLRPGRQGAISPVQSLSGTHGLNFEPNSHTETGNVESNEQTTHSPAGTAPTTPTSDPKTPLSPPLPLPPPPSSFHDPIDSDEEELGNTYKPGDKDEPGDEDKDKLPELPVPPPEESL